MSCKLSENNGPCPTFDKTTNHFTPVIYLILMLTQHCSDVIQPTKWINLLNSIHYWLFYNLRNKNIYFSVTIDVTMSRGRPDSRTWRKRILKRSIKWRMNQKILKKKMKVYNKTVIDWLLRQQQFCLTRKRICCPMP